MFRKVFLYFSVLLCPPAITAQSLACDPITAKETLPFLNSKGSAEKLLDLLFDCRVTGDFAQGSSSAQDLRLDVFLNVPAARGKNGDRPNNDLEGAEPTLALYDQDPRRAANLLPTQLMSAHHLSEANPASSQWQAASFEGTANFSISAISGTHLFIRISELHADLASLENRTEIPNVITATVIASFAGKPVRFQASMLPLGDTRPEPAKRDRPTLTNLPATTANQISCTATSQLQGNLYIRRTGLTEPIDDIIWTCTGGTPTATGQPVQRADIRLRMNGPITSRRVYPGYSEALLLVDEPHSPNHPVLLLACGDTDTGDDGSGSCRVNGAGANTYDGKPGHPNVFQGVPEDPFTILFRNVPIDPPGNHAVRILRFTNIRIDSSLVPVSPYVQFNSPHMSFTVGASVNMVLSYHPYFGTAVSYFQYPFASKFTETIHELSQCTGAATGFITKPNEKWDLPDGRIKIFLDTTHLRLRNVIVGVDATSLIDADVSQNVSTNREYGMETMFFANGIFDPGPYQSYFPVLRGLDRVGLADVGTRVFVQFTLIPAGARVFIQKFLGAGLFLTETGPAGDGKFKPLQTTNPLGFAEIPVVRGTATAMYEARGTRVGNGSLYINDPYNIATAYISFLPHQAAPGVFYGSIGLAPTKASTAVPRFDVQTFPQRVGEIIRCAPPVLDNDLGVNLAKVAGFSSGNYRITVFNARGTSTRGASVFVEAQGVVLSGNGWTCNSNRCSRSDLLVEGEVYPDITMFTSSQPPILVSLTADGDSNLSNNTATDRLVPPPLALQFVPITPCRVVDTRKIAPLTKRSSRDFSVPRSGCGVPANAAAFALNLTVVPKGSLGYVTLWPTGSAQPEVSTLNSLDGRIKANAAIVAAGTEGGVSVFATDPTDVILDINGYFVNPQSQALAFYPIKPCRVVDTRIVKGDFGSPALKAGQARSVPVVQSDCGIPADAQAFSLNATVVPSRSFGYLTLWPSGSAQPLVSTLNAVTGAVTANAAIVPAGPSGAINVFASDDTHLILDANGYFAPAGSPGAQAFYAINPCRVLDTRSTTGGGAFQGGESRELSPQQVTDCGLPSNVKAYSLNATVVPPGPFGYLTLWPSGEALPLVSTLNALDGAITSNAAIVPHGLSKAGVSAFASHPVQLILDITGFFAP